MTFAKQIRALVNRYTFIGMAIGVGVGLYMFSILVPSGMDMIKLYYPERFEQAKESDIFSIGHTTHDMKNPYMMKSVTTEKQFLEDMIKHHEAAVTMAQQALFLNPHAEVKKLANDIIAAQTTEITLMKQWLAAWWK